MTDRLMRGLLAGTAGTAAMSVSEWAHVAARPGAGAPVDFDVSEHVVLAAGRILRLRPRSRAGRLGLFVLTHVGYGTAFGLVRELLEVAPLSPRLRTAVFFAATESLALSMFPVLGGTPPPWRWSAEQLTASVVQHAVYAVGVSAVRDRLAAGA
jgi:hypothetical protein